jgi:serralysin
VLTGDAVAGTGNGLDNEITGNARGNRLDGGAGNDRLAGGDGVDFFIGGAGNDIFVGEINATKTSSKLGLISVDVITDFQRGSDMIDLSGIDAVAGVAGDQAFTFDGTSSNKYGGDLTYKLYTSVNGAENALGFDIDGMDGSSSYIGPVTVVLGNVDGGAPDFAVVLLGANGVGASDFIL